MNNTTSAPFVVQKDSIQMPEPIQDRPLPPQSNREFISIREASKMTGICAQTLRKLSDQKKIRTYKTLSGQRKFDKQHLEEFCATSPLAAIKHTPLTPNVSRKPFASHKHNFIYARTNSECQAEELCQQVESIKMSNECYVSYVVITDTGSGTNFKRKGLTAIIDACLSGTIGEVVITNKDRLSRIAYDLIEQFIVRAGGSITVLEDDKHKSTDNELSEDLLAIARAYCRKK